MGAGMVAAIVVGFWPVQANVFSDSTYSCGSGFIHSVHTWNVDSTSFEFQRSADETATGLPASLCPNKVDSRRDIALLLLAVSLAIGLLSTVFFVRPRERNFGSTMFANRRRISVRTPVPIRRPLPEDPGVK
jgi:hypothetical protein